jgi:hypothetical protein
MALTKIDNSMLVSSGFPLGSVLDFAGIIPPTFWAFPYGQEGNRITQAGLFNAITALVSGNTTVSNATISSVSVDLTKLGLIGARVEGAGIPSGTTIASVTSNTLTLSANATATATGVSVRILPHGVGDGSTTFNYPDYRGVGAVGRDNMGGTAASRVTQAISGIYADRVGAIGGDQRMHQHNHAVTDPGHVHGVNATNNAASAVGGGTALAGTTTATISSAVTGISIQNNGAGSSQNMPPTVIQNKIIFVGV